MNTRCPPGCYRYRQCWQERMLEQKAEALSETNRYYFWLNNKRDAFNDQELLDYYADPEKSGGARDFAERERQAAEQEQQMAFA